MQRSIAPLTWRICPEDEMFAGAAAEEGRQTVGPGEAAPRPGGEV